MVVHGAYILLVVAVLLEVLLLVQPMLERVVLVLVVLRVVVMAGVEGAHVGPVEMAAWGAQEEYLAVGQAVAARVNGLKVLIFH